MSEKLSASGSSSDELSGTMKQVSASRIRRMAEGPTNRGFRTFDKRSEIPPAFQSLQPGDHLCCLYSSEREHRNMVTPFLLDGLRRGDKVIYICDTHAPEIICEYLLSQRFDPAPCLEQGQLQLLSSSEAYLRSGKFDADAMIDLLASEISDAKESGFDTLRISGEMTWALRGFPGSDRVIEYENRVNECLADSSCIAFCQYDRRCFDASFLLYVLQTHPLVAIDSDVHENFYHVANPDLLSSKPHEAQLEYWLRHLKAYKAAFTSLMESEHRFRVLFEQAAVGVAQIESKTGRFLNINEKYCSIVGYSIEEMIDLTFQKITHPDDLQEDLGNMAKLRSGEIREFSMEKRYFHKDGSIVWVNLTVSPMWEPGAEPDFHIAVVENITERKEAVEARDHILERSTDLICIAGMDGFFHYVNPAWEKTLGYSEKELLTKPFLDFIHPDDHKKNEDEVASLSSGKVTFDFENRYVHKDGSIRTISWTATPVVDRHEMYCIGRDISERKLAEEHLRTEQRKAQEYLDIAASIILALDDQGMIILLNEEGSTILECDRDEVIGKNWFDTFLPEEVRDEVKKVFAELITGNLEAQEYWENKITTGKGNEKLIRWHNRFMRDERGRITGTLSSGEDITEIRKAEERQKRLEAQIQHVQKLESLGILAGGIAHDFANILVAILGNASLALEDLSPSSPIRPYLDQIEESTKHATDLCKQMLAYSGKGQFVVQQIDVNQIVEEMGHMLRVSVSKRVDLIYDMSNKPLYVNGDVAQIRQIIMNLITNASESIGEKNGRITLKTDVRKCDTAYLRESYVDEALPEGHYVIIEVKDSGCGMDSQTLSRLFDPFFTTKFTGRGLGLATVLGIVRGHGGAIRVKSHPGYGTTFTALFPALHRGSVKTAPEPPKEEKPWQGTGKILVVDDEAAIRTLASAILERAGFEVLQAADGLEGVRIFSEHAGEIRSVLLDLTMPHMDGSEAMAEMRKIRSDVPILLSSGYHGEEIASRFLGMGLAGFIEKPYTPKDLLSKVQEILCKDP